MRLVRDEVTLEGLRMRRITDLALVRTSQPAFSIGWTIMHVIDDSSPLARETEESLRRSRASVILSVSGTDETTGHVLIAREEYPSTAILWNKAFRDVLMLPEDGAVHIDFTKFHDVEELTIGPQEPTPS